MQSQLTVPLSADGLQLKLNLSVPEFWASAFSMAGFCCSIEMEPRTLNGGQLYQAREVAVDIVQKNEPNQASDIFIEGMRPVATIKEMEQMVEKEDSLYKLVECKEKAAVPETSCQCLRSPAILESPDQPPPKEPLSAPF